MKTYKLELKSYHNSRMLDPEGNELHGVERVCVTLYPENGMTQADIKLNFVETSAEVAPEDLTISMTHPVTGVLTAVRTIVFEDGTKWEAP